MASGLVAHGHCSIGAGKVGVTYLASKTTDLFVEGVYQGSTGFTVDSVNYDPLSSWGARIGARYRFCRGNQVEDWVAVSQERQLRSGVPA